MGTWYAIEWWFLQRLTRGVSSVGILALPFSYIKKNQMESLAFMFSLKISVYYYFFED